MRTCLYLRISTDKSGDGLGIERQREDCRKLAQQRGWTVVQEIVENNTSATIGPRPGFEQLLQLMQGRQIDAVVVWHVDRLLRKMTDLERVIELVETSGVRLVTVSGDISLDTDMGRMVGRIMASVARAEVERKSARQRRAAIQKAQAGKPHGSKRAYGYEADLVTINESEAAVISEMARRIIAGHSFKEVAFWANTQGHRTTTGKIFYPLTVRNLLHKKRYAGIREHNGAEYPAIWGPVFDTETWERLQLTLRERHDRNGYEQGAPKARKYLLTGLVYCGRCGWPLSGSKMYDTPGKNPRRVYVCMKRTDQLAPSGCNGLRRNADALEHWVAECLFFRLDAPELSELLSSTFQQNGDFRKLLDMRDVLLKRITGFVDDYASGLLTRLELARAKQTAEAELARIEQEIRRLSTSETVTALVPAGQTVRQAWEASESMEWKRSLLRLVISKIIVNPGRAKPFYVVNGKRMRFSPDLVDVVWRA
jgi:DNA invertase Pin-like site-specific DNA recombinase